MAYQNNAIGALTDIPALAATFAAANGWTVAGQTYGTGTGLNFTLSAAADSLTWTPSDGALTTASIRSPRMNGTEQNPVINAPTQVHFFASATPRPYLAIVVQYDYNLYRHLYLGNMVKSGTYDGGEVISATNVKAGFNSWVFPVNYRTGHQHLFAVTGRAVDSAVDAGGVRVVHANNPTPWRRFWLPGNYSPAQVSTTSGALGGFGDDLCDGYLARGRTTFSGAQILVPINLFASMPITNDCLYAPIGHVPGVRLVHMQDLEPGQSIKLGDTTWRCFPAARKSDQTDVQKSASGWAADESSYYVGYAYPDR